MLDICRTGEGELMATGEENLANAFRDWLISDRFARFEERGPNNFWQSPIECVFFHAVQTACSLQVSWFEFVTALPADNQQLQCQSQVPINGHRVDYLFTVISDNGPVSHLIVECDGHDFHERTKDQAKRDRSLDRAYQEGGYTVFRFTGSEIYRDAFACARQVLRWAENVAWKR